MGSVNCFRSRRFIGAAAAALALGLPPPVSAEPLVLTPQASVSEQYNDNVFFDQRHVEDYVTRIGAGLSLQYKQPRLTTFASAGTSAAFFARQTQEDDAAATQHGTLSASYRASPRLTLTASDTASRVDRTRIGSAPQSASSATPGERPGPETGAATLLPRGEVFANAFAGRASYRLSPRWNAGISYQNGVNDFTNPGGRDVTHRAGLSFGYVWDPALSSSVVYSYSRLGVANGVDTESHNASLAAGYQYDPTWSLSASAGAFVNRPLQSNGDSIASRTGPLFDLVMTKHFEHSALSLGGSQTVTTSAGIGGAAVTLAAFLEYQVELLQRLSGSMKSTFSQFNTNGTDFRVFQVGAALSHPLGQYLSMGLSYSYRYRESSQPVTGLISQGTVDGNLVQIFIAASYPAWQGAL